MGIKAKKKDFDCQEAESLEFIADTIEDQDTTIKDDEVIYYKAKKIVPRQELKLGMERWEKIEIQYKSQFQYILGLPFYLTQAYLVQFLIPIYFLQSLTWYHDTIYFCSLIISLSGNILCTCQGIILPSLCSYCSWG